MDGLDFCEIFSQEKLIKDSGMNKFFAFALLLVELLLASCSSRGEMTDLRDGKKYRTVKIGDQIWMAQNLNYEIENSHCYNDDPKNCEKYGRLYNWQTAKEACPAGWHLPSKTEFQALIVNVSDFKTYNEYYDNQDVMKNADLYSRLRSSSGWREDTLFRPSGSFIAPPGNGTDDFGFSAIPSGLRRKRSLKHSENTYNYEAEGYRAYFWSSSKTEDVYIYMNICGNTDCTYSTNGSFHFADDYYSIRCIKD